jgi:hypothetical protein
MRDFIGQLRARQAQINAEIGQHLSALAALSNELSDIAAAGRVFAGIVSIKTNTPGGESGTAREAPGDKRTEQSEMRGLEEGLEAAPRTIPDAADTSGTMSDVSAAMTSLLGDADAASHFQATDKSGAASSDKAAPAPSTLAGKLRELHSRRPALTSREAAEVLGEDLKRIRESSSAAGVKWARVGGGQKRGRSLTDLVIDLHARHPFWMSSRIAQEIGCTPQAVRNIAKKESIDLRPVKARPEVSPKPAQPVSALDEPSPTPKPETPPAAMPEPAIDRPRIPRPLSGSKFYLVNDKGEYLNRFCAGFTTDKRTAWIGTEQQLTACRRNFDIARDLTERAVTKEQQPVPVNREVA